MNRKVITGTILITIGILIYSYNLFIEIPEDVFYFLIISTVFFAAYFLRGGREKSGNIGFLIPASICFMVALGMLGTSIIETFLAWRVNDVEDVLMPLSIGTAFFLMYLLHTSHYNKKWPLYPMGGLYFAAVMASVEAFPVSDFLPIILILAGILLILLSIRKKTPEQQKTNEPIKEVIDLRENNQQVEQINNLTQNNSN